MFIESLLVAAVIASLSLLGVLFFGQTKVAFQARNYILPLAVGVFLSLVLYELIPETLAAAPEWGGVVIGVGFISFYLLAHLLHRRLHRAGVADCDKKGGATLLLIGDGVHNFADGVILGGAFMINPAVGIATAVGLALHEVPQEIVEFGVLLRAGYSKREAAIRNLFSASSIFIGVIAVFVLAEIASSFLWVIMGLAAGNLLYLAASDLLPRIHNSGTEYGSTEMKVGLIVLGFALMTALLVYAHDTFPHGHGHVHDEQHAHNEDGDHDDHEDEEDDHHDEVHHEDGHEESHHHDEVDHFETNI